MRINEFIQIYEYVRIRKAKNSRTSRTYAFQVLCHLINGVSVAADGGS